MPQLAVFSEHNKIGYFLPLSALIKLLLWLCLFPFGFGSHGHLIMAKIDLVDEILP